MKQKLILLSGVGAAGKTTTAGMLHDKFANAALVDVDYLYMVRPCGNRENLTQIKNKNAFCIIRNYIDDKYENIIIVGLVWSQHDLDQFMKEFSANDFDVNMFWLEANVEVRLDRVIKRGETGEFLEKVGDVFLRPELPFKLEGGKYFEIAVESKPREVIVDEIWTKLQ